MKNIILLMMIYFTSFLFAQDEVENPSQSLQGDGIISQDSLDVDAVVDTFKYDIKELRIGLNEYLKNIDEETSFSPEMIHIENFHFQSPFELPYHFIKNGFTVIPYKVSNLQIYQNHFFANKIQQKGSIINFSKDDYNLPIAITESYMGLGDNDMNHAVMDFKKGDILGIDNLNLQLSFLGQSGKWLGIDERSKIIDLHLHYPFRFGILHLYNTTIDQRISSNKLATLPELTSAENLREYTSDNAIIWENKLIDLGFRYEKVEVDSMSRELIEVLLKKEISYKEHYLMSSCEYFLDSNFVYINYDHTSKISFVELNNNGYFNNDSNYLFTSELAINFYKNLFLNTAFTKWENTIFQQEIVSIGTSLKSNLFRTKFIIGMDKNFENQFLEFINESRIKLALFDVIVMNYLLMDENGLKTFEYANHLTLPKYQTKNALEIQYLLPHNNAIKFGLEHNYLSNHQFVQNTADMIIEANSSHLNAYLQTQITKQFTISVNAVNLTNSAYLFSYPTAEQIPKTHFNFNVKWIFIN